jgi:hypothetical protein
VVEEQPDSRESLLQGGIGKTYSRVEMQDIAATRVGALAQVTDVAGNLVMCNLCGADVLTLTVG